MFVEVLAMLSFYTTPVGKPVTKGVYSISRNPMYVGHFFVNIGISIACLSWIFLLVAIVAVILEYSAVASEERTCLKQYGDAYREYMNRTPRWIGIPKSKKNDNMLPA
jgi:protein-S-isoprenylcysteine O-methyltransferase Ste14